MSHCTPCYSFSACMCTKACPFTVVKTVEKMVLRRRYSVLHILLTHQLYFVPNCDHFESRNVDTLEEKMGKDIPDHMTHWRKNLHQIDIRGILAPQLRLKFPFKEESKDYFFKRRLPFLPFSLSEEECYFRIKVYLEIKQLFRQCFEDCQAKSNKQGKHSD